MVVNFEASEASKTYHFEMTQAMEEIDIKAKPADLPSENKELESDQVIASLYDPAQEAAAREAEAAEEAPVDAADVPSDNGSKPEEAAPAAE